MKELWSLTDGKKNYPIDSKVWIGESGDLLNIKSPFDKNFLFYTNHDHLGMWKYSPQIPLFDHKHMVSFGEGLTPVVNQTWHGVEAQFKLEFLFPTGSYKDRGATVLLSKMKELGIDKIVEDSSGNAGCAIAAYAAKAKIKAQIFVSSKASPAKIKQMMGYGAEVIQIEGTREDVADAAKNAAKNFYYASHSYNPFFFEGTKTFAYEVWEQCKEMPEEIIFPVGNGTLIIGAFLGFIELKSAGLISKLPKLSAAQADNCASLVDGADLSQPTVAEGIAVKNPIRRLQIKKILEETGGNCYRVKEFEISQEHQRLHQCGYFVELTSAVATAAISQSSMKRVLIPLTGHGLKNT